MPREVALASLRMAAASGLPFHVQLAGGEPLLEPQLVAHLGQVIRKAGWPATVAIQTNGTLLDFDAIDILRRWDIRTGVSLDGPPVIQERVRGNARATFRGLYLLSSAGIPVRITSVLSRANVMHLGELILAMAVFPNIEGIGLDLLVQKGKALDGFQSHPSDEEVGKGIRGMLEALRSVNRLRSVPLRWREWDSVQSAVSKAGHDQVYCHACRGESLAVHPNGSVYPCSQTVGDDAMAVGTVEHVDWTKLRGMYRHTRLRGECRNCSLKGRCPGDCPSRLMYNNNRAGHTMCRIYQTIAERSFTEEIQ